MARSYHITVMLGGPSAEREISLRSGTSVAKALRSLGHKVYEVDPGEGQWQLPPETDVVFLALHGAYGEDGTIQTELERLCVPYTGCGPEASRIAIDKVLTKTKCIDAGIATAQFEVITTPVAPFPEDFPLPAVLKPVRQGSSVGLRFIERIEDWAEAVQFSFQYDDELLLEERIKGRETTVGILEDQALPIVEVRPKKGAYDYQSKYTAGATEYFCPAEFDHETTRRIQETALNAFRVVGGRDYGRIDIIVTPEGRPVVLEVNTLPGMTETSLLPKAAAAFGLSYPELCHRMVELALARKTARV